MSKTLLPFGPQHPVFPEPLQLSLTLRDETVVQALPTLGFVHRGLERLVEKRDVHQMIQITERVCGICSMIHALCYCQGIEDLMGVEVPPRAKMLRVVWSELHRIHSHLLYLGLFADGMGYENLFMQYWRIREKIMDINEATTGNRVMVSVNVIGGVRRDLDADQIRWIRQELDWVEAETKALRDSTLNEYTVKARTVGKGTLTAEQAYELGAAGPVLRGSGVAQDARQLKYAGFPELDFTLCTETQGDCWARTKVRYEETLVSIGLVRQALDKLPDGDAKVAVKGFPKGEIVTRVEQPRGELAYYIKGNGTKHLERLRIRTPTFANVPPLLAMLPGCELADVPVIALSIDPCISCTER